jgi:predicted dehydrogenase
MKALAAGKHVLLEKPSADRASETKKMYEFARKQGLVLLEAFHYRCASSSYEYVDNEEYS